MELEIADGYGVVVVIVVVVVTTGIT